MPCPGFASCNAPLIDGHARRVTYLRVSVTDRCDLRCVNCMSEQMSFLPKRDLLSLEELDRLCGAFIGRGVRKLRLTGGEPLVRRDVRELFRMLSRQIAGLRGKALIANLPGKPASIRLSLIAIFPAVPYCLDLTGKARLETDPAIVAAFRPQPA